LQCFYLPEFGLFDLASHLKFFDSVDSVIESPDLGLSCARFNELRSWTLLARCEYWTGARRAKPLVEAAHVWVVIDGRSADVPQGHHLVLLRLAPRILFVAFFNLIIRLPHQLQTFLVKLLVLVTEYEFFFLLPGGQLLQD
jgi:hypothetical protein